MQSTRRDVLRAGAGLAATSFAGCLGNAANSAGPNGGSEGGYAAFFTVYDFARNAGGETFPFENPVPVGTMGHHWSPGSDLAPKIASSQAFVYLGIEGFQRWAVDTAEMLEDDYPDVVLVDALEGVELLDFEGHAGGEREDAEHDDHDHDGDDGDGHDDHGDYDPHYWTDPVRARQSVANIVEGLVAADPENEDVYEDNGKAYGDALRDLHERFESELVDRRHESIVVAGHNSYQYLADRYGFEVRSPVGVSPHAEPSQERIADTVEFIDDRGIDVVLYDAFETAGDQPPDLARALIRESSASETVALSPAEGTTSEWVDRGWGYVEQMREVNLPALKTALGAES